MRDDSRRVKSTTRSAVACLAVVGVLAGCATPAPGASAGSAVAEDPMEYTVDPLEGSEMVDAPVVPATEPGQCVDYAVARGVADQQEAHLEYLEARAISAKGWHKLGVSRAIAVSVDEPTPANGLPSLGTIEADGAAFVERRDDRLVDEDGHHWMVSAYDTSCSSTPPPTYYVDGDEVFEVDVELECEIVEHASCGAWPKGGCGVEPEYRRPVLVRVPPSAKRGASRSVKIKTRQCVSYTPELGYAYPP